MTEKDNNIIIKDLDTIKLYKPGVIAAYLALGGLPVGLYLYGLNILRRGQKWVGVFFCSLSALAFIMVAMVAASGHPATGIGFLGIVVAICVYQMEKKPYQVAIQRGATPAKWWPPIFLVIGILLLIILIVSLFPIQP
jgi:hypothetical protein